jgi:hypothetical protein
VVHQSRPKHNRLCWRKLAANVQRDRDTDNLVGHESTSVTERVYRKEVRPVITRGARAIDELFDGDTNRKADS